MIDGKLKVIEEASVSPFNYQGDNQLIFALLLVLLGFGLILALEKLSQTKN